MTAQSKTGKHPCVLHLHSITWSSWCAQTMIPLLWFLLVTFYSYVTHIIVSELTLCELYFTMFFKLYCFHTLSSATLDWAHELALNRNLHIFTHAGLPQQHAGRLQVFICTNRQWVVTQFQWFHLLGTNGVTIHLLSFCFVFYHLLPPSLWIGLCRLIFYPDMTHT